MTNRRIRFQRKYFDEIQEFCLKGREFITISDYPEHNDRYLKQCFYNLEEKFDIGIISKDEFETI